MAVRRVGGIGAEAPRGSDLVSVAACKQQRGGGVPRFRRARAMTAAQGKSQRRGDTSWRVRTGGAARVGAPRMRRGAGTLRSGAGRSGGATQGQDGGRWDGDRHFEKQVRRSNGVADR
ncbi:unnamed protein product [Ixodes pacificus]